VVDKKRYELLDHLGNVRVVITDIKRPKLINETGSAFKSIMVAYNNYDPFGADQPGRMYNSAEYRYGYNGKEKDDELKGNGNSYNYGARFYDPRVARFLSLDPQQKKFPGRTPYLYAGNNPALYVDVNGEEEGFLEDDGKRGVNDGFCVGGDPFTGGGVCYDLKGEMIGMANAAAEGYERAMIMVSGWALTMEAGAVVGAKAVLTKVVVNLAKEAGTQLTKSGGDLGKVDLVSIGASGMKGAAPDPISGEILSNAIKANIKYTKSDGWSTTFGMGKEIDPRDAAIDFGVGVLTGSGTLKVAGVESNVLNQAITHGKGPLTQPYKTSSAARPASSTPVKIAPSSFVQPLSSSFLKPAPNTVVPVTIGGVDLNMRQKDIDKVQQAPHTELVPDPE
jgi:RHS repeat-associated protein